MANTYSADRVEQAFFDERFLYTVELALPTAAIATAYFRPRPVDMRATAAEEQVVCNTNFNKKARRQRKAPVHVKYIGTHHSICLSSR